PWRTVTSPRAGSPPLIAPDVLTLQAIALTKHFPLRTGFAVRRAPTSVRALDGVTVRVSEGETLGIVGESGSGKTTLAKLFLRLDRPTTGSVLFDGLDLRPFGRDG